MNKQDEMLREILSDPEMMEKYGISKVEIENLRCSIQPHSKKIVETLITMINEMNNNRTPRQIYPQIRNINKI